MLSMPFTYNERLKYLKFKSLQVRRLKDLFMCCLGWFDFSDFFELSGSIHILVVTTMNV